MSRTTSSRSQRPSRAFHSSGWSRSNYSYRTRSRGSNSVPTSRRTRGAPATTTSGNGKHFSTVAKSSSPSPKSKQGAYCYSLNLKNGKKYVGYTTDIHRRLKEHFSGRGAKVTQQVKPLSVNHVQKCKSVENAKKAETIVYNNMKNYHGVHRVRGAGNTKRFFQNSK